MSEKFGLIKLESMEDRYLSGRMVMECADETAAGVDEEVMRILSTAYEEAKRLLSENRDLLDRLAEYLLEKESITGKQFMEIFREKYPEEEKDPEEEDEDKKDQEEADPETDNEDAAKGTVIDATV
jgi:cell division protease FtsH